jgi:CHAD domain-containing protein
MTFRLALGATLSVEVARIEHQELEHAFCELEAPNAEAVHEARKHIKKLRALLEAIRPALSGPAYRFQQEALRTAGRSLASARDRAAVLESFDRLASSAATLPDSAGLTHALPEVRSELEQPGTPDAPGVSTARDVLSSLLSEVEERQLEVRRRDLLRGIADTYERGRKRFRRLTQGAPSEAFHDLRKQVKYHRHHLALIENAWPKLLAALRQEADELGELLGHHHDLAMLDVALTELAAKSSADRSEDPARALEMLRRHLPDVRRRLEVQSLALAARVYVENPTAFETRLGGYLELERRAL